MPLRSCDEAQANEDEPARHQSIESQTPYDHSRGMTRWVRPGALGIIVGSGGDFYVSTICSEGLWRWFLGGPLCIVPPLVTDGRGGSQTSVQVNQPAIGVATYPKVFR
jgi:hypothetical protein